MKPHASRPSWASLLAFEAAARRKSFREAARDLGVTPSAISHQINALETWLGTALFQREARQVHITLAGEALARALSKSIRDVDLALAQARQTSRPTGIKVAALPLFAAAWLMPRLPAFEAQHPHLAISIDTSSRMADLESGEADVAIRNVSAPTAGLLNRKLLDLRATPLCTPELASRLEHPRDLAHTSLIGLSGGRADWAVWFAAVGCVDVKPRRTIKFDTFIGALEAAAQGHGVMLGLLPLIWASPHAANLVAPFRNAPREVGAYFVACRKSDRQNRTFQALISWLMSEMRADLPRLKRIERERLSR